MNVCDGCSAAFDDSMPLYPRLIVSIEAQAAKKLAEKEGDEMLCLTCWLEATESFAPRQLAMLLICLLQKIDTLKNEIKSNSLQSTLGIIEKQVSEGAYPQIGTGTQWPPPVYQPYTTSGDSIPFVEEYTTECLTPLYVDNSTAAKLSL